MENPLLPCKPKDPIPNLFIHHQQNPIQIPSRSPLPPLASPPPGATTHKTSGRHLKRLSRSGKLHEAISAVEQGSPARPSTYISLLQSCIDSDSIDNGRRLHAKIAASGGGETSPFVETKLVSMYAKCGSLEDARQVFDGMRERNLFAWSAMIGGCARQQRWEEVVDLFFRMMTQGVSPDGLLLPKILQACGNTGDLETGRLLHSIAARSGILETGIHVSNSVLAMYAKCGEMVMAKRFFEKMDSKDRVSWNSVISGHCQHGEIEEAVRHFGQMRAEGMEPGLVTWNILISSYNQLGRPDLATELMKQMESSGLAPDVFTWTSMISGFAQNKRASQALDFFQEMQQSGVEPNGMTVASAVSACAALKNLCKGKELHAYAVKIGSSGDALVGNPMVDMYAKCGSLQEAQRVFDEISDKDVFTWNSMIGGYMQSGYCGKAYELFSRMENSVVRRNVVTWNVMISGYIQNGEEEQAMELFHRMETDGVGRNTASWNTLIAGSLQNGHANEALAIFRQMQVASVSPNSVTILSILPVCTNLVSTTKVKEIHAYILKRDLQSNISIGNALIGTYSKSGEIYSAQLIFNGLSSRDLISWNSMIAAYVLHGCSNAAQDLFYQMKKEGLIPNQATFAIMISAYSRLGMINEGKELFSCMAEDYQLSPGLEHYRGMVELFGCAGRLREASDLIETMPIEPDFSLWDALFTAARIYENIKLVSYAAENMIKLEPRSVRTRRLLELIYAFNEKPIDAAKLRKPHKSTNSDYMHGCCWIEVRNNVHTFLTGQQPTKDSKSMYVKLNGLRAEMKIAVPGCNDTNLDIDEEKEETAGIHSEKLAVAFALVNAPKYRSIRIIKSARMCTDCHTTAKLISGRFQREILLKDPKCLHHFKDGRCSCKDYW